MFTKIFYSCWIKQASLSKVIFMISLTIRLKQRHHTTKIIYTDDNTLYTQMLFNELSWFVFTTLIYFSEVLSLDIFIAYSFFIICEQYQYFLCDCFIFKIDLLVPLSVKTTRLVNYQASICDYTVTNSIIDLITRCL